jgi:hypothetical protein
MSLSRELTLQATHIDANVFRTLRQMFAKLQLQPISRLPWAVGLCAPISPVSNICLPLASGRFWCGRAEEGKARAAGMTPFPFT